jgi:hypothetical protein
MCPVSLRCCSLTSLLRINRLQLNLRSPCITSNSPTISSSEPAPEPVHDKCMHIRKVCSCGLNAPTSTGAVSERLSTIHSFAISQTQPIFEESAITSADNPNLRRPQPVLRTESRRHLTGNPSTVGQQASETEAGSRCESTDSSMAPRWWFDRQVLTLGGVCEPEDEDENESEFNSKGVSSCEHEHRPDSSGHSNMQRPPNLQRVLPPLQSPQAGSSSSGSRSDLNTPTTPQWARQSFDFPRSRLCSHSQITSEPIVETTEQLELTNLKEKK